MNDSFEIIKDGNKYISVNQNNSVYSFDIYPLDLNRDKPPENFVRITSKCLKDRLISRNSTDPQTLLGLCHENATILLKSLSKNGYDPKLCLGSNRSAGSDKSLIDAYKNIRNVHQWVEVNGYILEICSEANRCSGKMYVSRDRPRNYNLYYKLTYSQYNNLGVDTIRTENIDNVLKKIK